MNDNEYIKMQTQIHEKWEEDKKQRGVVGYNVIEVFSLSGQIHERLRYFDIDNIHYEDLDCIKVDGSFLVGYYGQEGVDRYIKEQTRDILPVTGKPVATLDFHVSLQE